MIYENLSIYNFNLTTEEEALVLREFSDIKHDLLFPYLECNFSVFPEDRAYIEERVVIKSTENKLETINSEEINQVVYWYKPNDLKDLIDIINKDRFTYRCIVVPKHEDLENYRFKLFTYEHAMYQGEETRVLWIEEAVENDYKNNIHPRILKLMKEK
ncbi:hypothetical protein [Paenibacillus senegalensis]|uniref:hypothetical protein n=1 Tax=Paenibacillus senegalensis TaxID=1465766 RepID=UPI000288F04D|nr:hypothetical protein [Paenibacillus senegalensis]